MTATTPATTPWSALNTRLQVAPAPVAGRGLYRGLGRRLSTRPHDDGSSLGIWQRLDQRVDFAQYCPRRVAEVAEETIQEAGHKVMVLRSPTGNYLRLNEPEQALWHAMDGTQSVAQLATMGFLQFKRLLPVAELVQSLRAQGFLADAPVGIYRGMRERETAQSVEGKGERLLDTLRERTFDVRGIDGFITRLYRMGGKFLFTRPFALIHALLTVAGLTAFTLKAGAGETYQVLNPDNVLLSLLALWAALLVSFVLHELAHALAVKHSGRRVVRGGVMIYYGMPAAFVDTSDMWLAGRNARILVSLAGPLSDLLVGSLAALAAFFLNDGMLAGAAYKLAVASYLAALFNFNPLLELDGYFILVDWLRLPNLRRRALDFISGPFWQKLRTRATFSHEERFFSIYGLLAALYTLVAIVLTVLFWQRQLVGVLATLWSEGWLGRLIALVLLLVIGVPFGLGLLFAAWGLIRAAATWVAQRGYGRSPLIAALLLTSLAFALTGLPLRYGIEMAFIPPLLWLIALGVQIVLKANYRGAQVAQALNSFLAVSGIELLALGGYLLLPQFSAIWAGFEIAGFVLLMFAGFVTLLDVDLHHSRPSELTLSAIMLGLAFLVAGLAIGLIEHAQPQSSFLWVVIQSSPIYLSLLALALLLPQLIGLRDSRLLWCWLLLWMGIAAQTVSYLLEVLPLWRNTPTAIAALTLSSGLWAAAWCTHYLTLRQINTQGLSWPLQPTLSEAERLQRAFQQCYAGCYRLLHTLYGNRRAQALDDRMDVLAATANWDITLDREQVRISPALRSAPLDLQGARYAEVLRYTVATIEEQAGASFARRAVRAAYDALPWPEREAAGRHVFPNTPWANEISRTFGDMREARMRLLRQVEIFVPCNDAELQHLAAVLEPRPVSAGDVLLAANVPPAGLWIVEAGEVAVMQGETLVQELHRGDFFGEVGDRFETVTSQSYRATIASSLLYLPGAEIGRMLKEIAPHANEGLALLEVIRLLERIPLFHGASRTALRDLAQHAVAVDHPARAVLVRQGQPSGRFYLIVSGRAAVLRISAEDPNAKAQVVAQLGPEEFFGELELLRGGPPMASVASLTPIRLLVIPHAVIGEMLAHTSNIARGLEQIGTGRMLMLR
ncbi:cyclic nucleotide-binding protein [Oscillochloris trichoides DG-6]|uniref:Cyclic nucleotide-binding protein n=1 Tax=Oscillochloris trichoides DG-6 TaxID=765420 RepID=E1IG69_9CHLR|nr:cyclic nucleotide-binding domain-containing protein [Oscillochloris trichoides]EFO79803.1 cyclic nucleotide-binding protein [Oscillochloris trichoides DG-6]